MGLGFDDDARRVDAAIGAYRAVLALDPAGASAAKAYCGLWDLLAFRLDWRSEDFPARLRNPWGHTGEVELDEDEEDGVFWQSVVRRSLASQMRECAELS